MKQNEYFVFPDKDFKPNEIDLMKSENYSDVSPHLFRVQKLSSKDYWFRHHLDTTVDVHNALKGITWLRTVSYTHLRAHETVLDLVCRLLLENKK